MDAWNFRSVRKTQHARQNKGQAEQRKGFVVGFPDRLLSRVPPGEEITKSRLGLVLAGDRHPLPPSPILASKEKAVLVIATHAEGTGDHAELTLDPGTGNPRVVAKVALRVLARSRR